MIRVDPRVESGATEPTDRDVEEVPCPLCGSERRRPVHRLGAYAVVRCSACGVSYLSPRLVERAMLEIYRSGEYFAGGRIGYESYPDQEPALRATFRRIVATFVRSGLAGGDLLDVGCGYGFLLDEARSSFATCTGTEFSDEVAAAARARGLDVITGGVDDLPPGARFDVVFGGHLIEHAYDPPAFVARLADLLRPGGTLVLGTPDYGSIWRRVLRSRWPSLKAPEHVVYFDGRSLLRLVTGAGLENVRPIPYRHAFPLGLILRQLGLSWLDRRIGRLASAPVWVPATTVAVAGRRSLQVADGR